MKITAAQLKKYLDRKTKEQLINEIADLYFKFNNVKDFYAVKITAGGSASVLEKYKKIIKNEFLPDRGNGRLRMSVAKKAISDFKKYSSSNEEVADIMLYHVEMGVSFIDEYGDISENGCSSVESMYESALKFIVKNKIQKKFSERCHKITKHKKADCWGLNDSLKDMFHRYLGDSD